MGHHYTFYFDLILNLLQIYWNKNIELRPTFRTRYVKPNKLHILEHQFTYQSAENLNFVKICVVENKFLRKRCSMNWVFLNFSVIPNLHALFIFVILFKTVFFFNTWLAVSAFQLDLHKVMTLITWIYHGKHLNIIFSNFIFTPLNHNLHVQKTHSNSDFINSMIYFVNAIIFKMLSENQRKYEKKTKQKKKKIKKRKNNN